MPAAQNIASDRKENAKYLLVVSFILSILTLITFNVQNISVAKKVLGASTRLIQNLQTEKIFWEKFLDENPTYLEGWVELGVVEEELGNSEASRNAFLKAEEIDPNWGY